MKKTPSPYRMSVDFERQLNSKGYIIIGLDEVGRGALSGPIAVGAVIFNKFQERYDFRAWEQLSLKDSKKLTIRRREYFSALIRKRAFATAVAFSTVNTINRKGIVFAFRQAARKAIREVSQKAGGSRRIFLLVDAFKIPYVKGVGLMRQKNIIKGDCRCASIAAASIIAKVERDRLMEGLARRHKVYNWHKNKGYGTKSHIDAIINFGSTIHHRHLYLRNIHKLASLKNEELQKNGNGQEYAKGKRMG